MLSQYENIFHIYYIKCLFNSSLNKFNMYSGDNAPKHFFVNLVKDCTDLYVNYLSIVKPLNTLTSLQKIRQKDLLHLQNNFYLL